MCSSVYLVYPQLPLFASLLSVACCPGTQAGACQCRPYNHPREASKETVGETAQLPWSSKKLKALTFCLRRSSKGLSHSLLGPGSSGFYEPFLPPKRAFFASERAKTPKGTFCLFGDPKVRRRGRRLSAGQASMSSSTEASLLQSDGERWRLETASCCRAVFSARFLTLRETHIRHSRSTVVSRRH